MLRQVAGGVFVAKLKQYAATFRQGVHAHEQGSVDFNLAGAGVGMYAGAEVESRAGAIELFAPEREHSFACGRTGFRTLHLVFPKSAWRDEVEGADDPDGTGIDQAKAVGLGLKLLREVRDPDASSPLAVESIGFELLAAGVAWRDRGDARARWLGAVRDRLHEGELPTLAELAEHAGVNRAHLARSFSAQYGVSVGEYHRRVRLGRAARELACEGRSIARLASEFGFSDQSHLTRWFRRSVGVTPGEFERVMRRERDAMCAKPTPERPG